MTEDYFTHTEADAGRYAARFADYDDDRPSPSDLADEDLYDVMTPEELADPLYGALIDAIVALNRADKALTDATYGPSNGSRTDTTRLQNERDEAQDVTREAWLEWWRFR